MTVDNRDFARAPMARRKREVTTIALGGAPRRPIGCFPDLGDDRRTSGRGRAGGDLRVIHVDGPADAPFVNLVRTSSISFASSAGLSLDRCDELRIAVNEACSMLLGAESPALGVTFLDDGAAITVTVRATEPVSLRLSAESALVLKTMTDGYRLAEGGIITLEKRL
jgi:hypothetical protein